MDEIKYNKILNKVVTDPYELKELALKYLNDKYGLDFAPYRINCNYSMAKPKLIAGISDGDEFTELTTVICEKSGDEEKWTFADNYAKHMIEKAYLTELDRILGRYAEKYQLHLQAWLFSKYEDGNAKVDLSHSELLEKGSKYMPIWRIYFEYAGTAEEFSECESRLIKEIEDAELYGRYYVYCTEKNSLEFMDSDNFMRYIPDNEEPDGVICKSCRKYDLLKEES